MIIMIMIMIITIATIIITTNALKKKKNEKCEAFQWIGQSSSQHVRSQQLTNIL